MNQATPPRPGSPCLVDSLLHPMAVRIRQLLDRSERKALDNAILIDDEENILEAIRSGVTIQSLFHSADEPVSDSLRRRLPGVLICEVAKRTCKKLFENDKISRVFAIAKAPAKRSLASLLNSPGDLVVLDDVSISGNIGAIIRTSLAMAVGGIVLLDIEHVDIYDRRLIRASSGYVFGVPVATAPTNEFVRFAKTNRLPLMVTMPHAVMPVHQIASLPHRLAIVFGSEKGGCAKALVDAADLAVRIPTRSEVESLNVSAAAAITLYCRYGLRGAV